MVAGGLGKKISWKRRLLDQVQAARAGMARGVGLPQMPQRRGTGVSVSEGDEFQPRAVIQDRLQEILASDASAVQDLGRASRSGGGIMRELNVGILVVDQAKAGWAGLGSMALLP